MQDKGVQEIYGISLFDFLVLVANVVIAKDHPEIGYLDAETPLSAVYARLRKAGLQIKQAELEAALWACVQADEKKVFWHPEKEQFQTFLYKLLNARGVQKNFDPIYSYIKNKPKMGRPSNGE